MRSLIVDSKKLTTNTIAKTSGTSYNHNTAKKNNNNNINNRTATGQISNRKNNNGTTAVIKPNRLVDRLSSSTSFAQVVTPTLKTSFHNKSNSKMQQQKPQNAQPDEQQPTTVTEEMTNQSTKNDPTTKGKEAKSEVVKLRKKNSAQQQQEQQAMKQEQKRQQRTSNKSATASVGNTATNAPLPQVAHVNTTTDELKTTATSSGGGIQDTIYLCNFRVSVDGDWLCLKELQDINTGTDSNPSTMVSGKRPTTQQLVKQKRYSAGDQQHSSYNNISEDNGIFALHNFIAGRRLFDGDSESACRTNLLTAAASHAREPSLAAIFGVAAASNTNEWSHLSRDPAEIERSNLLNICKLVVKELLEQSLRYGRMLDSDHLPLQHFFIIIEHVLGHGLRPKKGLLGPRKELWDLLQSVEIYCPEAQDITASVRDLPTVRTHIGRARAWLRIALMQKKLSDYLQALIEHREDALYDYYEPHALMMSDEIIIIMGILVGLNVIDCNLCVKEEDLDSQQGVIDFSLYLRSSSRNNDSDDDDNIQQLDINGQGNMIAVLDQKNYIEELNRHLNATVTNLQTKLESLTTTNALMKEDLAIARNSLLALQAENQAMRQSAIAQSIAGMNTQNSRNDSNGSAKLQVNSTTNDRNLIESLREQLEQEKKKTAELEKELKLQISLKAETDMAMKLMEKDMRDKQDTITSLRHQLNEIKNINLEMYRKLQESEASLKHKGQLLNKLEKQKETLAATISDLERKWNTDKSYLKNTSVSAEQRILEAKERVLQAEADIQTERKMRISLQENEAELKDQIKNLESSIKDLKTEVQKNHHVGIELQNVRQQWTEAQMTLEELGIQLSEYKLLVAELQEKEMNQSQPSEVSKTSSLNDLQEREHIINSAGIWVPDSISTHCTACRKEFGLTRRKHHCRRCGDIFCNTCSDYTLPLLNEVGQVGKPVRVCLACFANHK